MRYRFPTWLTLFCLSSATAHAGAWTQEPGEGMAALNFFHYSTEEYFTPDGDRVAQPRFAKYEINPYLEYGVSKDWTIGASLFLQQLEQEQFGGGSEDNLGLGNSELFARYQLWRGESSALAVEPFLALPANYADEGEPRAGRGEWDAGLALLAGHGFTLGGRQHYAETRAAYRHRYGLLEDQWQLDARLGLRPFAGWTILPELQWILPADGVNGRIRSVAGQSDYRLLKLQLSAVYDLDERWSVQAGLFDHVEGANTGGGSGMLLSVWQRF